MLTQEQSSFSIFDTYVFLHDGTQATSVEVTPDFWDNIGNRTDLHAGRLITTFPQSVGQWSHWEMHPEGEEVLYLLSGLMELVLEYPDSTRSSVMLTAKSGFIVPRGVWHWAKIQQSGDLLVITRGAGTQTRPL